MVHIQNQHGPTAQQTDKYGNPVIVTPRRDQHGNPVVHHGISTGTTEHATHAPATGPTGFAATTAAGQGTFGHDYHHGQDRGATGMLRRSGSSSSSSSEDDGLGGRRKKKGMKDKIKEKLPGATTTDTTYGGTAHLGQHQEKVMIEEIKDKLPGGQKDDPYYSSHQPTSTTAPYGGTTRYGGEHPHEEKGVMQKIKGKLPGSSAHNKEEHYSTHTTTKPYGGATTYTEEHKEKKGVMDKIKDKLPGGHQSQSHH